MKIAIAAVAALCLATPVLAGTTIIDFSSLTPDTDFTSATFGDYQIVNVPGYGSGSKVFTCTDGKITIGDTVPERNGSGLIISRTDSAAFDITSATFGETLNNGGRVRLDDYGPQQTDYLVSSDGQSVTPGLTGGTSYFIDTNTFYADGGVGLRGLTVVDNVSTGTVPEPAAWSLLISGFGMLGGAMRVRRSTPTVCA